MLNAVPNLKKACRRGGQTLAALTLAASVAVIACIDTVDYTPFLKGTYFQQTRERVKAAQKIQPLVSGPLEAGFGRSRLTPTLAAADEDAAAGRFRSLPLAGYGDRGGKPATGAHDELAAKAVAVRVGGVVAVFVSADVLIIPREVSEMVVNRARTELQLDRRQLYFGATHTHASLGGWGEGFVAEAFAGEFQPGVRIWMAECLFAAMRQALADLQPATLREGIFGEPKWVRNRVVGKLGEVDPDFAFLEFTQAGGATAVIGSYAAHATVLSSGNMEFSADYPGAWQRQVEKRPRTHALFFSGAVGSHSPVAGGNTFEHAEKMGAALAEATLAQLALAPATQQVTLGVAGLHVALPELHVRVTEGLRLRPWVARQLLPVGDATFIQAVRLNQAVWVSTPCDYSGELALGAKNELLRHGIRANLTSFNGDYLGYVIPGRYYHLGGYEPRVMSFFGPAMPDYLDHLVRALTRSVYPQEFAPD